MQITIKSYTFQLAEPYHAGFVITKAEAQALNSLRAENIQNNLRKLVADATAMLGPDELLSQEALDELQAKFTEYDRKYQFQEKHTPRARLGDIEAEARSIARAIVEAESANSEAVLSEADIETLVSELEKTPNVLEEARLRVQARRRVMGEGLDSL